MKYIQLFQVFNNLLPLPVFGTGLAIQLYFNNLYSKMRLPK